MKVQSSRIAKKTIWRIYVIAISILVATVSSSHILADWIVTQQEQYASIINISGRQRMLSQRINGLIAESFRQTDEAERKNRIVMVDESIDLMAQSHTILTGRGNQDVSSVMSPSVSAIYFDGDIMLDQKVTAYIAKARELRDLAANGQQADGKDLGEFASLGFGDLLVDLNRAVSAYQNDAEAKLDSLRNLNVGLWCFTLLVILLELVLIFRPLARRLDEAQRELEDIAHTDPLTGCWNRRALLQSGELMWSMAKRHNHPLSVVICDIDKFKAINDTYGHGVGDAALRIFVQICLNALRAHDILGRFGGEEFVLILPETGEEGARNAAERIRKTIEAEIIDAEGSSFSMTSSFGTATLNDADQTLQSLIDRADSALYNAKKTGRNKVVSWQAASSSSSAS
jgi:diguanylate cyclase (GGDEF)-like protein